MSGAPMSDEAEPERGLQRRIATAFLDPWLLVPVFLAVALAFYLISAAHSANGAHGFPLDDPWIHLTYARNLALHQSFAYFPGDRASAGSTAPLYTLILSVGYLLFRDEKVLSYALGILFHAGFLGIAALWARKHLGDIVWAAGFVLILAFDPRIAILAVSGMETSLFLFLVALAFWARAEGRMRLLGIALGLALWVRPDALILAAVFGLDALLARLRASFPSGGSTADAPRGSVSAWLVPFAGLLVAYPLFNLLTGGVLIPNTFAAKHAYYNTPIPTFIRGDLAECFLSLAFWALTPLALVQVGLEVWRLVRGERGALRAELGWAIALPLAYMLLLPFSHRFSRYLVPALPAVALLGLATLRGLLLGGKEARVGKPAAATGLVLLAALVGAQAFGIPRAARIFTEACGYHLARHERAGRWMKANLPADAVIATHDVGAIAFYSERRVVDTVGLIQRDAIPYLHQPNYTTFLAEFFAREKVTHLAVLRNWLEVTNIRPIYLAEPKPEVLEVFPWTPGRTHLVPEQVSALNQRAAQEFRADPRRAVPYLDKSLQLDPANARTWLLLGASREMQQDLLGAEQAYRKGLELYPDAEDGLFALAYLVARLDRKDEARALLNQVEAINPEHPRLPQLRAAIGY
ncbi:MAG: hypothetical protein IPK72_20450 [Candidatus Eisenbacteria bacterium]|nr:hypothetical protein [Candidatus Eisenbacteria bacterium]